MQIVETLGRVSRRAEGDDPVLFNSNRRAMVQPEWLLRFCLTNNVATLLYYSSQD